MKFFKDWIIDKHPMYFKTVEERDWAYIAKREYNYGVLIKSAIYGGAFGNVAWSAAIYWKKKFVIWPLFAFGFLGYLSLKKFFFFKINKRLFDMCNLGEEYELGAARHKVLLECNRIQDVEDF